MIIGLVILGLAVILIIFGRSRFVFSGTGLSAIGSLSIVGIVIGSAFIPSFVVGGITVSISGFVMPIIISTVFFIIASKRREFMKACTATVAVLCAYITVWVILPEFIGYRWTATVSAVVCGVSAFFVGRTSSCVIASTFFGMAVGDVLASVVDVFAENIVFRLGGYYAFSSIVSAVALGMLMINVYNFIVKKSNRKQVDESDNYGVNADEYKKYFPD